MTIFERFSRVKAFALDVDGVLTDGQILINELGEQWRSFYTKDGYAMQLAIKQHYPVMMISGGRSQGIVHRARALGIQDVFVGCSDKVSILKEWAERHSIALDEILFMGDDIPDLEALQTVGFPTCPNDAVEEIKAICAYISPLNGGKGAVRDVFEKVMRLQGKWKDDAHVKSV